MEITSVRQLLKSICDYAQWNYAVFWKLSHYLPVTLTWEEGYYGYQKTNEAVEIICSNINFEASDEVFSSSIENSGGSADYSVQLLMTEMSTLKYTLGEGIVGRKALKGDHCWVFCKDVLTSNLNNNLISECPYEWLLQFASGIKTIVLVPVLPHGVLQFGSFEGVAEDLTFVANIRERFNSFCNSLLSSDIDIQASKLSSLTDYNMDTLDVSSSDTNNKLKAKLSGGTSLNNNGLTRLYSTTPSFIREEYHAFGEAQLESLGKKNKNEINSSYIRVLNDPRHIGQEEMNLSQMEDNLSALCQWINHVGESGEVLNGTCFDDSIKDMTEQKFGGTDTDHKICLDTHSLFDFSSNCGLSEALGPVASGQTVEPVSKFFSVEGTYSSSTLMSNKMEQDHVKDLQFLQEIDADYLLNAVVGNLDNIPLQSHSEESTLAVNYSDPKYRLTPALMVKDMEDFSNLVTSTPFDDNSSISIDETQKKVYGHMQPKSGPRLSNTSKKRARDSNTKKPRPRDRQLIMDKMKELRELVPDGTGCSIDNLLVRTIKHMLYLQNITNHAEKLKQCLQEVPECKKKKIKSSYEGRSYAFDFKSEDQVCPIIVENLGSSGNMLIEMICEEQGLFLEIANVIRRMKLTILKGVLESRSSTTWACFIIEVPRGFHRMDIMCPLLHLLQLSKNPVSDRN